LRVLFDLLHPVDVHFFKDVVRRLLADGHRVLVTSRPKDETEELLERLGVEFVRLSPRGRGLVGMGAELLWRTGRLLALARRFRPDVMVAKTGISIAWAGRLLGIPSVVVEDTEFALLQLGLCAPFASVICTGLGYERRFPGRHLRFNAPPALAYTHPARFTPDPRPLREHGLEPDEPYVVLRLKAWVALHDAGVAPPPEDELSAMVERLARRARPVISSERELPARLAPYANPLPVERALDLLAFADLYVGEGSCMAAEAACLGTPAIYLSPESRRGYLDELERRFGHVSTVRTVERAAALAERWLCDGRVREAARRARQALAAECEEPVEFILDVIRSYRLHRARRDGAAGG
jgi:hypothetical protein